MLETAIEHYRGNSEKARREVKNYMDDVKKTLSEAEREFFAEKAGGFIVI
jgi:hypothetical protein